MSLGRAGTRLQGSARLLGFGVLLLGSESRAEPINPSLPHTVTVGVSPSWGLQGDGTRAEPLRFPHRVQVLWRTRVNGGMTHPPAVDREHAAWVPSPGSLTRIYADGRIHWSFRLSDGSPGLAPVITSDGTCAVVTTRGTLIGLDRRGAQVFERSLPLAGPPSALRPTMNGGMVLAAGREIWELDYRGTLRNHATAPRNISALLAAPQSSRGFVIVLENGAVAGWAPPSPPRVSAAFGGPLAGEALRRGSSHLVGLVRGAGLVEIDLPSGARRVLASEGTESWHGSPVLLPSGEIRVATLGGLLLGFDESGTETLRLVLGPSRGIAPGMAAPHVLADDDGSLATMMPDAELVVVRRGQTGGPSVIPGASCLDPIGLVAAGPRSFLLACREGTLLLLGTR